MIFISRRLAVVHVHRTINIAFSWIYYPIVNTLRYFSYYIRNVKRNCNGQVEKPFEVFRLTCLCRSTRRPHWDAGCYTKLIVRKRVECQICTRYGNDGCKATATATKATSVSVLGLALALTLALARDLGVCCCLYSCCLCVVAPSFRLPERCSSMWRLLSTIIACSNTTDQSPQSPQSPQTQAQSPEPRERTPRDSEQCQVASRRSRPSCIRCSITFSLTLDTTFQIATFNHNDCYYISRRSNCFLSHSRAQQGNA